MIILNRSVVWEATLLDLEETFLAVTGEPLPQHENIDAARVVVGMALLASENMIGHLGVPKGWKAQPMTIEQVRKMGATMNKEDEVEQAIAQLKPGSLAYQLWQTAKAMPPIKPRTERKNAAARAKISQVKATFGGSSRPQAGSLRNTVLKFIQDQKGKPVDVEAMEAQLGFPVRGHIQKLLEKKHVEVLR